MFKISEYIRRFLVIAPGSFFLPTRRRRTSETCLSSPVRRAEISVVSFTALSTDWVWFGYFRASGTAVKSFICRSESDAKSGGSDTLRWSPFQDVNVGAALVVF